MIICPPIKILLAVLQTDYPQRAMSVKLYLPDGHGLPQNSPASAQQPAEQVGNKLHRAMEDEGNRSLIRVESVQVREHRTVFPNHNMEAIPRRASVRSVFGGNFANLFSVQDPERPLGKHGFLP